MDWSVIWKTVVLALSGIVLLKMAGRKSISQMTLPQLIVMISIGTVIVTPIIGKGLSQTIVTVAILVATILVIEYLQLKFNMVEKAVTGKSKIVIENGSLNTDTLKKLRLTVDQLEMRLRIAGISKISDVKTATIEANGDLGYELMDDAKPVTAGELKRLLNQYFNTSPNASETKAEDPNLFSEIQHPNEKNYPNYLQ